MNTPAKPDAAPALPTPTETPTRRDFLATLAASGAATAALLAAEANTKPIFAAANDKNDPANVSDAVDWAALLRRHDMVWEAVPFRWEDGAFIGDGQQGAMVFADAASGDAKTLRFEINRSDVTDRGKRLAVGQLRLPFPLPASAANAPFNLRLDLWNGEMRGDGWRAYAHATNRVLVCETVHPGEITWHPEPALDARKVNRKELITDSEKHPDPTQTTEPDGTHVCVQPLTNGAAWAVAWREDADAAQSTVGNGAAARRVLLSVGYSAKSTDDAKHEAVQFVQAAAKRKPADLEADHRKWWHEFWPQSFLSIPDARMESFYYLQMYKLASATGKGKPALDLMGPWFRTTPWTAIWWNLNIQLTYWPVYGSGRFALGASLLDMLDSNVQNLASNVENTDWQKDSAAIGRVSSYDCRGKGGSELGNLTWTLHNYFWHCRAEGDEARMKTRLFPLLKRAVEYLLHHTTEGEDGHLHLPLDISPEYPVKATDTNYNLGLLRWGCRTLLALNARYNLRDKQQSEWRDTLLKLTPYPKNNETGLHIGEGVPLTQSHRHFSHLLMVFPLQNLTLDTPETRALIEKTLDHWINFKGGLQGYSYTGASAISTILGRKTEAVALLNTFLDKYVKTNTMYTEAGPVIETPLSAACAIYCLLLRDARQGTDGDPFDTVLHVFGGVPDAVWPDAVFHNLRAGGAFVVSAARKNNATAWVRVHSTSGDLCKIVTGIAGPVEARGRRKFALSTDPTTGITTVDLKKNESVLLLPQGVANDFAPVIVPVAQDPARSNFYGLKRKA